MEVSKQDAQLLPLFFALSSPASGRDALGREGVHGDDLMASPPGPMGSWAMPGPLLSFGRQELVTKGLFLQANGDKCVHHTQCFSDCCLIDLERRGAFCTSKSHVGMACLPQVRHH